MDTTRWKSILVPREVYEEIKELSKTKAARLAGNYDSYLIGTEILKKEAQMITKGTGLFHKRLVENRCPKCAQKLKVIEKMMKNSSGYARYAA